MAKANMQDFIDSLPMDKPGSVKNGALIARGWNNFEKYLKARGRPKKEIRREVAAIRIPSDALAKIKALGRGWSTRAGDALAELIKKGVL